MIMSLTHKACDLYDSQTNFHFPFNIKAHMHLIESNLALIISLVCSGDYLRYTTGLDEIRSGHDDNFNYDVCRKLS